LEPFCV